MFIKIGNKVVECDENRVIKATSKEIKHADGRIDVQVFVPCLKIQSKVTELTDKELKQLNKEK
jgi:hypothetical protein